MSHENSQHIVVVGTKPDIIKQAPIYHELRNRGHARGAVPHRPALRPQPLPVDARPRSASARTSTSRCVAASTTWSRASPRKLALYLRGFAERGGFAPITYVHGDTTTAMAGALATFGERQALVHVEAGLRTLSPKPEVLRGWLDGMAPTSTGRRSASRSTARASTSGQPGAVAGAVQHPDRRRRLRPARRAGRAQPRVPHRRGLRAGRDRRRRQLGGRRAGAGPRPPATRTSCSRSSRRWATARSSASACTAARTPPTATASTC